MTTTPAMPELPETDYYLGFCDEGGEHLHSLCGYTADQMDAHYLRGYNDALATLQAQPAEVSDEFLYELWDQKYRSWIGGEQFESIARAILALRPQAVPKT